MDKERRAVTKAAAPRREILLKNLQELVENCVKLRQNVMRSGWIADNCGRKTGRDRSGKSCRRLRQIDQPAHDPAMSAIILRSIEVALRQ